ncbi:MAG: low molecular weight phosphatase family protein [bacterium]
MKIVFLCRRNRFRSQIAEAIFNHFVKDGSFAISAGLDTLPEELGVVFSEYKNGKVKNTIEAMKNHGIDISKKYAKKVTPEMLVDVDKIIFLTDNKEKIPEWFDKYQYEHWQIENFPGAPTLEKSEEVIQILKDKINIFVK